jgi:hypothetical protein
MPTDPSTKKNNHWNFITWSLIAVFSILGWLFIGQQSVSRVILIATLSLASFMVGCLVAFLFTSYGEESATVGKVRDWLVGGLTGVTIVEFSRIKALLLTFAVGPGSNEFALVVGVATIYSALGFFFMFFQRELILNVLLAESRAERLKLEGTGQAGKVLQRLLVSLPPSILSGVDNVDDSARFKKHDAERLRTLLYSSDVKAFLDDCEEALRSGKALDWDAVSKAANLHYYRTYFEKGDQRAIQAGVANVWIMRALNMNPLHVDFTVKYADTLGMMDRYDEAVAILERLERTPDAPAYVKQWLGYFLLFVDDRLTDSIKYSDAYHQLFPSEYDSVFNIACAYAQMYCRELHDSGQKQDLNSKNRRLALDKLKEALRSDAEYAETVSTKWTVAGESFDCFLHDAEFRSLTKLPAESSLNQTASS